MDLINAIDGFFERYAPSFLYERHRAGLWLFSGSLLLLSIIAAELVWHWWRRPVRKSLRRRNEIRVGLLGGSGAFDEARVRRQLSAFFSALRRAYRDEGLSPEVGLVLLDGGTQHGLSRLVERWAAESSSVDRVIALQAPWKGFGKLCHSLLWLQDGRHRSEGDALYQECRRLYSGYKGRKDQVQV